MAQSVLDRLLLKHNRELLVGLIGDTYLLLWDLYYQKYRGQALYEDLCRVLRYVKGRSTPNVFEQGIGVDINRACQLFEKFDPANVPNFDMETDSTGVIELEARENLKSNAQRYYHASVLIAQLYKVGDDLPINGIQDREVQGVRDLFYDLRGSVIAIRGPRNRHQHGGLDVHSGELQAAAAAIRVCEIHQYLWQFLERHANRWRPVLNRDKHYEFSWDSARIEGLKIEIRNEIREQINDQKPHQCNSIPANGVDFATSPNDLNIANTDQGEPAPSKIVRSLDELQQKIEQLLDRTENPMAILENRIEQIESRSDKLESHIETVLVEVRALISQLGNDKPVLQPDMPTNVGQEREHKVPSSFDSSHQVLSLTGKRESLMELRNEIAVKLSKEYTDFRPWHNILMRDLISHIMSRAEYVRILSAKDLIREMSDAPQFKRIKTMNEAGDKMIERQLSLYAEKIIDILCAQSPLVKDDDDDVPF